MVVRAAALLVLLAGLAVYYAASDQLSDLSSWQEVAFMGALVFPAMFGLIGLALPFRRSPWLGAAVIALGVLTVVLQLVGLETASDFAKFAAVAGAGWWVLRFFEHAGWVLLVAALIVPIDLISVARGPTRDIVENREGTFDWLSVAFPTPGSGVGALGLPDILFFSLFLAAADRFCLRTGLTWLLMTLSFGGTIALAVATDRGGFAALPLLSAAFVIANFDLLAAALSGRRLDRDHDPPITPASRGRSAGHANEL